jgi:hypothetical protein
MGQIPNWVRAAFIGDIFVSAGDEKHHESNIVWGPIGIASSLVISVVAAMKQDLRWLFIFAWPLFAIGIWKLCRQVPYRRLGNWIALLMTLAVGLTLLWMNAWLSPKAKPVVQATAIMPTIVKVEPRIPQLAATPKSHRVNRHVQPAQSSLTKDQLDEALKKALSGVSQPQPTERRIGNLTERLLKMSTRLEWFVSNRKEMEKSYLSQIGHTPTPLERIGVITMNAAITSQLFQYDYQDDVIRLINEAAAQNFRDPPLDALMKSVLQVQHSNEQITQQGPPGMAKDRLLSINLGGIRGIIDGLNNLAEAIGN